MTRGIEADVTVVGAGPVGLTLAMDLVSRGVQVTVLEMRHRGEPPGVKCNHVAARSMEIFRTLGVADEIRRAGLPADYPHDIAFRTSMTGREITRIPIPGAAQRAKAPGGPDTWWPTPEPPHRINQMYLEPILFEHACQMSSLTILNRVEFVDFTQNDDDVTVVARALDTGSELTITSGFLVGCDGGRSRVRSMIGSKLGGDAVIQRVQSTYIRAPQLLSLVDGAPAWGNISLNSRRSGTVYAIDGCENWLVHNYLRDDEPDFDSVDRDWAIREILGVGADLSYDVISCEDWYGRRLVANRFRDRRAFICGDAAHLWVPYAGYGMNAGLADVQNLSWLLGARIKGWGGEGILDAYERERLPITEQVSHFTMNHAHAMAKQRKGIPPEIEDETPEGEAARATLGSETYDLNVQQYCAAGLNFGYYYDDSPIIAYDDGLQPPYTMGSFAPSTVPGCRVPHVWLRDGRSLYDALSNGYTLLRFDRSVQVNDIIEEAVEAGVPLKLLDVVSDESESVFTTKLVLSRPDRHVGWRGNQQPDDSRGLLNVVRGHDVQSISQPRIAMV